MNSNVINNTKDYAPSATRRTKIVWITFCATMTFVCGILLLANGSMKSANGAPLLGPAISLDLEVDNSTTLLETQLAEVDEERWQGIVIHHSGSPAGDAGTLDRYHQSIGLEGLGYHFVLGNGNGMGDGVIQVGYRWSAQKAGAHAIGPESEWQNQHAIAVCLIGNGEVRAFSGRQMQSLAVLVKELQQRFNIPAEHVRLHRDIADVASPGRFFTEASFRERLISRPD